MNDLMSLLFQTDAFKICEENKPFIYTSGKIGPYFINTQFLYGSQKAAQDYLDLANAQLETEAKDLIPANLFEELQKQYETNETYKTVIDTLTDFITSKIDLANFDYISGGERRDWFFSIMTSYLLGKPHITLYKDLTAIVSTCDFEESTPVQKLTGKRILHIADLLNTASSYLRFWVPAIKALGANITTRIAIVDRMQGAGQVLSNLGVRSLSLLQVNETLFEKAKELGIINEAQLQMLHQYTENPDACMKQFLIEHPEFLEDAIHSSDPKTAKYAKACKEQNPYNL